MGLIAHPIIPDEDCTLQTCSLAQAHFTYLPSLAGNALYLSIFAVCLVVQIFFGWRYRTWGFLVGLTGGLALEIVGYAGRVQMHSNPFTKPPFLQYLICLTIGPAFLSASIYLCLARIVVVFGEHISRFRPATYTIFFVGCDFISLLLQAIGGGIAATANPDDNTKDELGIHIMIAGLSFQVASLFVFIVLCSEFALRVYQRRSEISSSGMPLVRSLRFKGFLFALAAATLFIFIRSCFRVAELNGGFHGTLANQEVTFMLLEGMMIVLAVLSLTAFHPGLAFGEHWHAANFTLRKKTEAVFDEEKTGDQMASGST